MVHGRPIQSTDRSSTSPSDAGVLADRSLQQVDGSVDPLSANREQRVRESCSRQTAGF